MRRVLWALLAGSLSLVWPLIPATAGAEVDTGAAELVFVARINALRVTQGVPPLAVDSGLTDLGRRWSGVMADAGRIYHNPNLATDVTAKWLKLGENVGMGNAVDSLFDAFVASPAHYKNLVDPDFTHLGVGVVVGSNGVLFTSHQFMKLSGSAATAPTPTTAAPAPVVTRVTTPPTTQPPRPRRTTTTTTPAPPSEPEPEVAASPEPQPDPAPVAARPVPRGVMVLDLLRVLDGGR